MRKYMLVIAAVFAAVALGAQTPPAELWKWHRERGEALYRSGKYLEAYEEMHKAERMRGEMDEAAQRDLDYYLAMSACRAGKANAKGLLEHYLGLYPGSPAEAQARLSLGNVYYDEERYSVAIEHYSKVDAPKLDGEQKNEYNFKAGYSRFMLGEFGAMVPFMQAVDFRSPYYSHAQYCLGYAAYRTGDYAKAKEYFMSISNTEAYAAVLPFYMMHIEFSEGNYHYVTENGGRVLAIASGERALELARMIGESWFQLGRFPQAAQYLMEYEARGGVMDREANYMVGFSQYMMEDWQRAGKYLLLVPGPDDRLSQNAAYHLADVYLRSGDKQRAMQSFAMASSKEFDPAIAEDALFNYGKLQYELGGGYFNEAINILNRYLALYPSSKRAPQVKEYLAAAYYNSKNYDAAYEAIVQMPDPDNNVRAALQKITYFRALEQFQSGNLDEASRMLEESLRNRYNAKYTALAGYWQGEILYRQGKYAEAVEKYNTYIRLSPKTEPENIMARYNAGYASFNMQDWVPAREKLDDFLLEYPAKDSYRADTYNRIGDIEFSNRGFWRAIEFYDEAAKLGTPERYYAQFQRAMVLGRVDRPQRKIESLTEIINKGESPYAGEATYQLGREYMAQQNYGEATKMLGFYVTGFPSGERYVAALMDLGLAYQNLGNSGRSLESYKKVVETEKHSQAARDAMAAIRNIYVEMNDVDGYFAYAGSVNIETDLGAVQRDSLAFASAQRVYLQGDRERAASALSAYIAGYPKGAYVSDAIYYSGENALAQGKKKEAYDFFSRLAEMYKNPYTLRAFEKVGELGIELGHYDVAADAYNQLSYSAASEQTRDRALAGYLRAVVMKGDAAAAEAAARDVLKRAADNAVLRQADYELARAMGAQGRGNEALAIYVRLAADVSDAVGAESAYRQIEAAYNGGNAKRAEELVYAMAEKNTAQAHWLAKAFLLLGDIYAAAGDSFQARATYQSVLDGYSDTTDGIIEAAAERIRNLK